MVDSNTHVLVVDDNPATRYSTARVLRTTNWKVSEAASGEEALAKVHDGVDLVVLDVHLPDIDGFEVCRRLRQQEQTRRIPVLHLSATFVKDAHKVQGLDAGADGYLTHPVEPPVLIATANALLRARRAELAVKESEFRFRAIFDNALNGVAVLDGESAFVDVNPAMCLLLGLSRDNLIGRPLLDFVPAARHPEVKVVLNQLERSVAWRGVFPLSAERGSLIHLDWHISSHSSPGLRLAIVSDITERLIYEQEREALLESERAARTEAERANRLKDDFLATLSHELRTPLNAIVGWAQLLNMGGLDVASVREGLQTIERNALAQAQMISDLLEVSRITSGKVRLQVAPVRLAEMIEAAISSVIPAADAKGIRIQRTLDPTAGPFSGDAARLQQVLWNLLTNAIKFTPKNGEVHVTLQQINSHIEIRVTDDGQGISPDLIDHVFERFRQGDASTTREHGGLGLGLAICKQLVEMHGGSIRAESEGVGQGASFIIAFPLTPMQAGFTEARVDRHTASDAHKDSIPLSGIRVLVVEDDPDSRALLTRIVISAGADAIIATNVDQALDKIEMERPNVLVSDLGMPGRDGFDLIREVRARGYAFQEMPAIALTAFARPEDCRRCLSAGFQVHLSKPVDPLELKATIASLVGRTG